LNKRFTDGLISDEVKKLSDEGLAKAITEKPKHPGGAKSLLPDQLKTVVSYIRRNSGEQMRA
jgi:hypothetical protein